jgi:trimethylamine:corrinoid methyltransferase-like protein
MTVETNHAEKEFVFEDWLAEGIRAMRAKARERKHRVVPEEFCTHMRAARKEFLLAFRSLIDEAVKETEPEPPKKATKIKVE